MVGHISTVFKMVDNKDYLRLFILCAMYSAHTNSVKTLFQNATRMFNPQKIKIIYLKYKNPPKTEVG